MRRVNRKIANTVTPVCHLKIVNKMLSIMNIQVNCVAKASSHFVFVKFVSVSEMEEHNKSLAISLNAHQ